MGEILARGLDDAQPSNVHILRVPWLEVTMEADDPELLWPGNRDGEPVPPGRRYACWKRRRGRGGEAAEEGSPGSELKHTPAP